MLSKLNEWFSSTNIVEQILSGALIIIGIVILIQLLPFILTVLISFIVSAISLLIPIFGIVGIAIIGIYFLMN